MRTIRQLLTPILITFSMPLMAGQQVGNGGHVVSGHCFAPNTPVTLSLDLYEAKKQVKGWELDLGPNPAYRDKVRFALDRLHRFDPRRAELYASWFDAFDDESAPLPEHQVLPLTGDIGNLMAPPSGCEIKQAAIQVLYPQIDRYRYYFQAKIWDELDEDSKAALVLHELVFRDALLRGHTTSQRVRYIVALLTAKNFEKMSQADYDLRMERSMMTAYYAFMSKGSSYTLAYYDDLQLTQNDAKNFCLNLPGDSGLFDETFFSYVSSNFVHFKTTAVAIKMAGDSGNDVVEIWAGDSLMTIGSSYQAFDATDSQRKAGVICWLNPADPSNAAKNASR